MIEYNELINNIVFYNFNNFNSLNLFLFIILSFIFSLAFDILYGELPTRIHPVVIIGSLIDFFKNVFIKIKNRLSGVLVVLFSFTVVSLITLVIFYISSINIVLLFIIYSLLLSSTFSINMLLKTAIDVFDDLTESYFSDNDKMDIDKEPL